jgi:hypothetical protein
VIGKLTTVNVVACRRSKAANRAAGDAICDREVVLDHVRTELEPDVIVGA